MSSILCIEDSEEVKIILRQILSPQHDFIQVATLKQAELAIASSEIDLILLDIQLPDGDGLRFCSALKNSVETKHIPIIILSGSTSIQEKVIGFELGIEDYISKPFDAVDVKIRVNARVRKAEKSKSERTKLATDKVQVDLLNQKVIIEHSGISQSVDFSPIEFRIFSYLMKNREQVKSREKIINFAWGNNFSLSDRTVDSHISRIRKKILGSDCTIEAVAGTGYRLTAQGITKPKAA